MLFVTFHQCKRISIHAPRTGSDYRSHPLLLQRHISIHAPRTGSDRALAAATIEEEAISIHAPRTGSDKNA